MATEIIAKNETVINKNHVLKLAFFYSSANIKSASQPWGREEVETRSTCRTAAWVLTKPSCLLRVSDRPLPLHKALGYIHALRRKTFSARVMMEKGNFNKL